MYWVIQNNCSIDSSRRHCNIITVKQYWHVLWLNCSNKLLIFIEISPVITKPVVVCTGLCEAHLRPEKKTATVSKRLAP